MANLEIPKQIVGRAPIKGIVITALIVVFLALGIFSSVSIVPAGYTGIVYNASGGVQDKTLAQGWHFLIPVFQKITLYTTSTEQTALSKSTKEGGKDPENFSISTSDGKQVDVDLEFSYAFDTAKLPETFTQFKQRSGSDIEQTFIKPKMKSMANEVSTTFGILDVYGEGRTKLNKEILAHSKEFFKQYGIDIQSASITQIRLDDQTNKMISAIVDQQQELKKVELAKAVATQEAERLQVEAKGKADAAILAAQGEKQANELKQASLTPSVLQQNAIDKWDGKLPVVSGSNGNLIDPSALLGAVKK